MNFTLCACPPCSFAASEQTWSLKVFPNGDSTAKVNIPIWNKELACLPASYIISLLYNLWVYLLSSYSIIWRLIIIIMIIKINNNFIIHTVPCLAHSRNSDINQFIISFQIVAISKASWKEKKEVGSTLLLKPTTWLSFPNSTQQILSKLKDD